MAGAPPTATGNGLVNPSPGGGLARALVFTDVVGSTKLKQVLGDREGTMRILQHHAEARVLLREVGRGREVSTAGDGMFLWFETPALALRFALQLQRRLRELWPGEPPSRRLRDRIGIHFGPVELAVAPDGTEDLLGLEVDRTSRVMSLAEADQILLTRAAFDRARQAWTESQARGLEPLSWISHGFHHLAGLDEPQEIFEVGEVGLARLAAPNGGAERIESDAIAGWRPAAGEFLPGTSWRMERRLGGGKAEEVWVATHVGGEGRWVYRFCFQRERLERLRRHQPLLERLNELVGSNPYIARLTRPGLTDPPFYLAYEYVPGRPLAAWVEELGPAAAESARLEIIAQVAEALEVAHRAGVVHGDLNPGAILVADGPSGGQARPQAWLTRLGLGLVASEETREAIRRLSQMETGGLGAPGPRWDGHFYAAPEILQGGEPTAQSDLFALGVVAYQLLVGDFMRPLTADWSAQIADPILREDLAVCLASSPGRRLATAGELAVRLRSVESRRRQAGERERMAFFKGVMRTAVVAVAVIGVLAFQSYRAEWQKDRALVSEAEARERLVRLQVTLGNTTGERGDGLGAALYQAEALRLAAEAERVRPGSGDEDLHRLRFAATLQQTPLLVHAWGFDSPVTGVQFHPTDEQVLTLHRDGQVRLIELSDGRTRRTIRPAEGARFAQWVGQGRQVVTAGPDGFLRWWDATTGLVLGEHALGAPATAVWIDPGSPYVVVASERDPGYELRVFRADTRDPVGPVLFQEAAVQSLALDPLAREFAAAGADGRVRRWSLPELQALPSLPEGDTEPLRVFTVQYSPEGTHLLTASEDFSGGLWSRSTGRREAYFWHESWLSGAVFSRDGSRILTTSFDGTACLWSPIPFEPTLSAEAPGPRIDRGFLLRLRHDHSVLQGAVSSDLRRIVTACFDQGAWLWNADTGAAIGQLKHGGYVGLVRFHPDARRLLTAADEGSMKLWDLGGMAADQAIRVALPDGESTCRTPDGTRLLAAPTERSLQLWDTVEWRGLSEPWEMPAGTRVLTLDRRGERVVLLGDDSRLHLLRAGDGGPLTARPSVPVHGTVRWAQFLEDPPELIVLETDPVERLRWISLEGGAPREVPVREVQEGSGFLSPDGRILAITGVADDGTDRVVVSRRNPRNGIELAPSLRVPGSAAHVAFSPNSEWMLVTSTDISFEPRHGVLVPLAGGEVFQFKHDDGVLMGAFSPNGSMFGSASEDSTVQLRRMPGGELTQILGHRHQVYALAFSADGRMVATGSRDHTARVWDARTGDAVTLPILHAGPVGDLWFTPDGRHLVTARNPRRGDTHGEVSRWPLTPTELSVEDVKRLAELLSSRKVQSPQPPVPLGASELQSRWEVLYRLHPGVFEVRPEQKAVWHASEARLCAQLGRWTAAADHWEQVRRFRPLTSVESAELDRVRQRDRGIPGRK